MKSPRLFTFVFCTAIVAGSQIAGANDRATVFAAASLRGALDAVLENFEEDVRISYGGSGAMARQVAQGAPADAVILANPVWDEWLNENGIQAIAIDPALLSNRLVLIGSLDATPFETAPVLSDIQLHLGDQRLAMGQRRAVPAGRYAKEWLENIGVWHDLESALAETENVRLALALVARGETPLGIVYQTDAQASPAVRVLWHIDEALHDTIRYSFRALTDEGLILLEHLRTDTAREIFGTYGFLVPESAEH